jgi:hypothetical protein
MKNARIVLETLVIIGYAIGFFPFGYLTTCWIVIPLTLVNFILALSSKKVMVDLINIVMAFLALIPIFGFIPRIVGIILSSIAISDLTDGSISSTPDSDFDIK